MPAPMSKDKEAWKTNMIKTLRITSVIAAVLAVVFFVFPAIFGVRGDEQIEEFLKSPGAIDDFRKAQGDKSGGKESQISPLVKQAEAFALYLNPPAPPKPKQGTPGAGAPSGPPGPSKVSPKFELIGTSYYAMRPELSLALIDEPGKGLRWVRQSSKVGHLIIDQVKDGRVFVRDGQRTFELVAERPKKRSLVKSLSSGAADFKSTSTALAKTDTEAITEENKNTLMEGFIGDLKAMQAVFESEKNGSQISDEKGAALKDFISELETIRIGGEEANELGRLGKELEDVQRDSNQVQGDVTESDANLSEPNNFDKPNVDEPNSRKPNPDEPNLSEPNSL
jgi:hypothetical protein